MRTPGLQCRGRPRWLPGPLCHLSPPPPLPRAPGRRVRTRRHAPAVLVTSNSSFFRGTSLSLSNAALDYEGKSGGSGQDRYQDRAQLGSAPGKRRGRGRAAER